MKSLFTLLLSLLLSYSVSSQSADSTTTERPRSRSFSSYNSQSKADGTFSFQPGKQKHYESKDNVIFATSNLQMSPIENEIFELEALECKAVLKRDTEVLTTLWARDFTQDNPSNELVLGKNPLPYYASFSRMVENFTAMDNVVYTSGYELVQPLKTNGKMEEPMKRNYFHTWTRRNGVWKLTTKTNE